MERFKRASAFRWSSAAAHVGAVPLPDWLAPEPMRSTFTPEQWATCLQADSQSDAELELRRSGYTGRAAGSREFVENAESSLGRKLAAQTGGRPGNAERRDGQPGLFAGG